MFGAKWIMAKAAGRRNDPVSSSLEKDMHCVDWETKRPRFVLVGKANNIYDSILLGHIGRVSKFAK